MTTSKDMTSRKKIYAKHGLKTEWIKKSGCKVILPNSHHNKGDIITWQVVKKHLF